MLKLLVAARNCRSKNLYQRVWPRNSQQDEICSRFQSKLGKNVMGKKKVIARV